MVTLTVRHDRTHDLQELKQAITAALRRAQQGAPYQRLQKAGLLGMFRTLEVRWSQSSGWHPHIHALVAVDAPDQQSPRAVLDRLVTRYLDRLHKAGATAELQGQDVRLAYDAEGAAEYAGKGALELAHGEAKTSTTGSVHPFQLAKHAHDDRNRQAAAKFREYAAVMPGTPQGRITDRLIDALAQRLDTDRDALAAWLKHGEGEDEENPGEEPEPTEPAEHIARLSAAAWDDLHRRNLCGDLIARIEAGADFSDLEAEGWPVSQPNPTAHVRAATPPDPSEDLRRAAHRRAPASAPSGTDARSRWVSEYCRVHSQASCRT